MRRPSAGSLVVAVSSALVCTMPPSAAAGTQDGAVVALHAGPHNEKGDPCLPWVDLAADGLSCRDFTTSWPLNTPCDVYLVVARGNPDPGVAGLSCGVLYNNGETGDSTMTDGEGVDLYGWTLCTSGWVSFPDPRFPWQPGDFPASGGGARITWNAVTDCQRWEIGNDGVHTLAGVFCVYAYGDDVFEIIPNRKAFSNPDEFQVGDCNNQLTDLPYPEAAGAVAFGSGTGYNPCQAVPVTPTTWSRLKARYHSTTRSNP